MSDERSADWWKAVPCHFTWGLERDTNVDYKTLKNDTESTLDDWDELHSTPPCHPLLLLGFLHVSKFRGAVHDPLEAIKVFKEVRDKAQEISKDDERLAFIAVCLANQLWTADDGNDELPNFNKESVLNELSKTWDQATPEMKIYMDAIAVCAFLRLRGLKKYKEAEKRCRGILRAIPTESEWHHWLGQLVGRRARANIGSSQVDYDDLDEEIQCYEKALELDPKNVMARLDLAHALLKKPGQTEEARKNLEMIEGNRCCAVLIKKGRFYRIQKEDTKALRILMQGTTLKKPRAELFFQIALLCFSLSLKAGEERNYDQKNEYMLLQLQYLEKTLQAEPAHHLAMIKKAVVLGFLGRNEAAEMAFKRAIRFLETDQTNLVEAQFRYAEFLTARNRRQVTREGAQMYEKVIATAIELLKCADDDEIDDVRERMKKYASKAKTKLLECYRGNRARMDELEKQLANLNF